MAVKVLVAQLYPTLSNPMEDSSVHGILQSRILKWVNIPFSRGSSRPKDQTQVSYIAGGFFHLRNQESPSLWDLPTQD